MLRVLTFTFVFLISTNFVSGQGSLSYYIPTHYFGLFSEQLTSARAAGMGHTTITQDGIETAFYNPASISPVKEKFNIHFNYASGDPIRPGSKYPFIGLSYKLTDKLSVGASAFGWKDNDPIWTTIIGTYNESVDKRTQSMYGLNLAYEVIPNLHVGLAGNYLLDKAVPGTTTSSSFIMSLGGIYDWEIDIIKHKSFTNQKIRFATSFINLLMDNKVTQRYEDHYHFREMPIFLNFGGAYKFSLPLNSKLTRNKKYFDDAPQAVNLGLHFQFRDQLAGKDPQTDDHENNSNFGVGAEAWFFNRIALRMGYYNEKRPSGTRSTGGAWVTQNKHGFTWGYGTLVPLNKLTRNKLPFDAEVNFVTGRLLKELGENITHPAVFTESNFTYSIGVNLKWANR